MISDFKNQIKSFIEDIRDIKNLVSGLSWVSKLSWLRFAVNPYCLSGSVAFLAYMQ
jgi:hypothetical protein